MSKKVCIISCCSVLVVLVVVCVVLSQTVFKVRNPDAHMLSATINSMQFNTSENPPTVSATVTADLSIRNPNILDYRYKNGYAYAIYRGRILGEGEVPGGMSPGKKTLCMNLTMDTHTDHQLMLDPDFLADFTTGAVPVTAYTKLDGWVNLLGVFKPRYDLSINCSMNVVVFNKTIQTGSCLSTVRYHRH
ncbi:uncharacterized protein [Aristolochia californica]|uniref:uncharacterized protein n=1 Tax=Aristolochia californica TaxID=171875 RepID=UPI0035DD0930